MLKKILIAGVHSYIGDSFKEYLRQWPGEYLISELDTKGIKHGVDLNQDVDVVFCVAGVAHIRETSKNRHLFFDVNRDLVVSLAKKAKSAGVHHFILLSTMSVYGMKTGCISKATKPKPKSAYGQSKYEADEEIKKMEDENFAFACLRPPMVYGRNCKGNYQTLRRFALKVPVFPNYQNQRSMVYIGNLCHFIKDVVDQEKAGLFFPQNSEYVNTSDIVREIAKSHGKKIWFTRVFNWIIKVFRVKTIKKVFGSLTYESVDTIDMYGFKESIELTES